MKTARHKAFCRFFLGSTVLPGVVLVATIIFTFGSIGTGSLKPSSRLILLSATPAEEKAPSRRASNGSEINAAEQTDGWQVVKMRVTAYCPCEKCCGEYSDGVTACGHRIRSGDAFVAADKQYAFGTEMIIAGYNNGEPVKVLDRGGAIRGNRLDVFFQSHDEALTWGVKYLYVKVRPASSRT